MSAVQEQRLTGVQRVSGTRPPMTNQRKTNISIQNIYIQKSVGIQHSIYSQYITVMAHGRRRGSARVRGEHPPSDAPPSSSGRPCRADHAPERRRRRACRLVDSAEGRPPCRESHGRPRRRDGRPGQPNRVSITRGRYDPEDGT